MFGQKEAIATVAVKNVRAARKFYEGILGLVPIDPNDPAVVNYQSGNSTLVVYESAYAGTNKGTAVTWNLGDDLESTVRSLGAKGVTFEHYDLPNAKWDGDILVAGDLKVAWFKDPDGNIHSIYRHDAARRMAGAGARA